MKFTDEQIKKIKEAIINLAKKNYDFRKNLLNDPKKAIEVASKNTLGDFEVKKVVEESEATDDDKNDLMTIVLPDLKEELDLEDLEDVAGGSCGINYCDDCMKCPGFTPTSSSCPGEGAGSGNSACI